jgi:SAM-dependent methyltransferase
MDLRERQQGHRDQARRHPWELARLELVLSMLGPPPWGNVLDVGAGDGYVADALLQRDPSCTVRLVDAHYTDVDLSNNQPPRRTLSRTIGPGRFAHALLLDVLEHERDDTALLATARDALEPGGTLCITVPAWPALFSAHDRFLLHERRYRPRTLLHLVQAADLEVIRSGGVFASLLLPRALQVARERLTGDAPARTALADVPATLAANAIERVLRADVALCWQAARWGAPLPGLSAFALARRRP